MANRSALASVMRNVIGLSTPVKLPVSHSTGISWLSPRIDLDVAMIVLFLSRIVEQLQVNR